MPTQGTSSSPNLYLPLTEPLYPVYSPPGEVEEGEIMEVENNEADSDSEPEYLGTLQTTHALSWMRNNQKRKM